MKRHWLEVPWSCPCPLPCRQKCFGEGVQATPAAVLAGSHAVQASLILRAALQQLTPAEAHKTVMTQKGATVQTEVSSLAEVRKTAGVHEEGLSGTWK